LNDIIILEMSTTPRREFEDTPVAKNAKELITDDVLENSDLNSGDLMSCVDEAAKPGQDIHSSHVSEARTSEIETATKPSEAHLSNVPYVECSLTGIQNEAPGATKGAIVKEECGENRVQIYDRSEREPHSGGTSDSSAPCTVRDFNQEAQDSVETKNVKGMCISAGHDVQGHVADCEASDIVNSLGTGSRRRRKIRESCSLLINSPGSRKSKSVCDKSHVERISKPQKSYRTRSVKHTENTESKDVTDKQELNLENTSASFTGLHLQCADKTEPSPNDAPSASFSTPVAGTTPCDVLDFCSSSGVRNKKRKFV
jgi:hypothetical protein